MLTLLFFLIQALGSCGSSLQSYLVTCELQGVPAISFSKHWISLGPFRTGTREASWGADPLEAHGGFVHIPFNDSATFPSSLVANASVRWSTDSHGIVSEGHTDTTVRFHTVYPDIDWDFQQKVYGWAALQYQSWTRGYLINHGSCIKRALLRPRGLLEFYLNGRHIFGGDFYGFDRAPILVELLPGKNRLDIRLLRDVRAMGGKMPPTIDAEMQCELVNEGIRIDQSQIVAPDLIDGRYSALYISIPVTNLYHEAIIVKDCQNSALHDTPVLVHSESIRIVPGQTRPVAYSLRTEQPSSTIQSVICYYLESDIDGTFMTSKKITYQLTSRTIYEAHKITFLHPSGVVSYAILKPPHHHPNPTATVPLMLLLHGAGLEADSYQVRHSFDEMPDLEAFALFPTGMSPWSSDDWHIWGHADVLAAIEAVDDWLERMQWNGTMVATDQVFVAGHSNGGQGTWFFATHLPDRTLAAAPISGYSSIENYVPYTFWGEANPFKQAIVSAARASFKHELLLQNVADIPMLQQHGSADDNVPPYHSRLMRMLLDNVGGHANYIELSDKEHWFDGALTTEPLKKFYVEYLTGPASRRRLPHQFSVVSVATNEMGPKNGVLIEQLQTPERYGQLNIRIEDDQYTKWFIQSSNVRRFRIAFKEVNGMMPQSLDIDHETHPLDSGSADVCFVQTVLGEWSAQSCSTPEEGRTGRQRGSLDAVLRSTGPFQIYSDTRLSGVALQVSRNLLQYFGADSVIEDVGKEQKASVSQGNVIKLSLLRGSDTFPSSISSFPISFDTHGIKICPQQPSCRVLTYDNIMGAIILRPLENERLEVLVWGSDLAGLQAAARLLPMLTGVGQPDFIILGPTSRWQGLEGALVLGFFDHSWNISHSSYV